MFTSFFLFFGLLLRHKSIFVKIEFNNAWNNSKYAKLS